MGSTQKIGRRRFFDHDAQTVISSAGCGGGGEEKMAQGAVTEVDMPIISKCRVVSYVS